MNAITLPNLAPYVNRTDYSIEVKITKDGKEKTFNLPFMVDNQVWAQVFKTFLGTLDHTVEVSQYGIRITPTDTL
jgi:hypothetical protein